MLRWFSRGMSISGRELRSRLENIESKQDGHADETRERLGSTESKQDGHAHEMRERLGSVESKQDNHVREIRERLGSIESKQDGHAHETRERLGSIENKQDGHAREVRERLVNFQSDQNNQMREALERLTNIEAKLDRGIESKADHSGTPFSRFTGSPDQGFGHITYSQFGEDLMMANLFQLLGVYRPTYLDLGANDPIAGSNTALFYARGSYGTVVEANPCYKEIWAQIRPRDQFLNVGVADRPGTLEFQFFDDWSGRNTFSREYAEALTTIDGHQQVRKTATIRTMHVNDIVDRFLGNTWPDLVSLDVEGMDEPVLRSARFGNRNPAVICVETRDGAGNDMTAAFLEILRAKDYVLAFRTWGNAIAIRRWAAEALQLL